MGNLCALYKGRTLFGDDIARRYPRVLFDEGELRLVVEPNRHAVDLDHLLRQRRCVIYAGETVHAAWSAPRVDLERLGQSGTESVYRVRAGKPAP